MSDVNVHTLDGCAGSDHGSCPQYGRVKVDVVELGSCSLELSLWLGRHLQVWIISEIQLL